MKSPRICIAFIFFTIVLLGACGGNAADEEDKTPINVGTSPGPYSELFVDVIAPILEDEGFTIENTDLNELVQADLSLDKGCVDLKGEEHTAYYKHFNEEKGANLTSITPIPTVPTGIFPGRKDSLDEIENNDVIGIPKDPSNAARAYAILQKADLLKLKKDIDLVKIGRASCREGRTRSGV